MKRDLRQRAKSQQPTKKYIKRLLLLFAQPLNGFFHSFIPSFICLVTGYCFDVNNVRKIKLDNEKAVNYRAGEQEKVLNLISLADDCFFSPHFDFFLLCRSTLMSFTSYSCTESRKGIFDTNIQFPYWRRYEINKHFVLPLAIFAISLLVHLRSSSAALYSHSIWIILYLSFGFFSKFSSLTLTRIIESIKMEFKDRILFSSHFLSLFLSLLSISVVCWWLCCDNLIACKTTQSIWISLRWNANNEINNNIVLPSNLNIVKKSSE